ncbi:SH3 domain-containing protein [Peribacillus sp. NPDC097264]|uniref:SH3 domain-containing protein n=1 Tax=Peribacillus sp. NPDC097264 TaxID=3390616 RepID=UPI003D00D268
MNKCIVGIVLCFVMVFGVSHSDDVQAKGKTYTLKVKSTTSVLNVREKPSTSSKIVGKLKKNQTANMRTVNYNKGFYEVIYKGKKAYVSMDYAEEVKPNERWIGSYYNSYYSGSGVITDLYLYKKTDHYIYFVSQTGYRYDPTGNLSGADMPWKFNNYYGKAKVTSTTKASFNSKDCKATFKTVGKTIRVEQKSKGDSCDFTGLGIYDRQGGAYEK